MGVCFTLPMEARRSALPIFLFAVVLFLFQCGVAQEGRISSPIERLALLNLRSSLGLRGRYWPIKADPCTSWLGVECRNGSVWNITVSGLRRNRLGRLNPRFNVDSLVNLTRLVSFNASGFQLPGSIPDWFGNQLVNLEVLDLRSCNISGSIPGTLGNLSRLTSLYLYDNNLAGSIPATLGLLRNLKALDLSVNSLTGSVPLSFGFFGNIETLELASNYLSGSIPPVLGSLQSLQVFNVSDNNLSGSIPIQFGNLSRLVELDLSKNSLSGSLPEELKMLRILKKMVIRDNELEGRLPVDLFSSLVELQVVDLSRNKLDGALSGRIWSMPKLQFLDASSNNFTGPLPGLKSNSSAATAAAVFNLSNNFFYGTLKFSLVMFKFIDFSGNYFQGKIVNDSETNATFDMNCLQAMKQRSSEDCRLFYMERGLSFDNFGAPDIIQPPPAESTSESRKQLIFILAGVVAGLGFVVILALVLVLFLRRNKGIGNQRGSADVGPVPEGDSPQLPRDPKNLAGSGDPFTYEQLLQATNNFNETNLIKHGHSGDLFRGFLEVGIPVVIKKVNLSSFKKKSYRTELDLFRMLSHTRFVPLLGHCLEHETDKLLVYKYMPNGDLANSFYRATNSEDDNLQSLDWITRLKVATGAAEGLFYLHHECNPSLVHRDVQASSILLDDKFEVRLGSLSEVCAQQGDTHQNVLRRLLWKPQTSEPGPSCSGSSSTNCAYDVYCFGKVLLELITGKLGIGKAEDASTKEWLEQTLACISTYEKELVTTIMDPSLIVDEGLLEEVWAVAIVARSCLNPKPSKRPSMKHILKALENPLKVVREESFSSATLRTTSSRLSWSSAIFGSWRQSSSDGATIPGQPNREGFSGFRQSGRVGFHGSGGIEHPSSHKRLSNEIFPEPVEMQDMEMLDEN